ncbi:MAG: hypothetical protein AAGE94_09135 [Acidobacteriota bacterium]
MTRRLATSFVRIRSFCVVALLLAQPIGAVTYLSAEPVPSVDVIGEPTLDILLALDIDIRQAWADALLRCGLVEGVIEALTADRTITTINTANTVFEVATGGFEGTTNPAYVFTLVDRGVNAVSRADVDTLSNALGYVLSQDGTVHLDPEDATAYDFALDYVVVSFVTGVPSGALAEAFFEHAGAVDAALFSGASAGFSQIGTALLFLQPSIDLDRFVGGMFAAATSFPDVVYAPLDRFGNPTSAVAGVAFPANDWLADPGGSDYLARVGQAPNADLGGLPNLNRLRRFHLRAAQVLARQAAGGLFREHGARVLDRAFACPRSVKPSSR